MNRTFSIALSVLATALITLGISRSLASSDTAADVTAPPADLPALRLKAFNMEVLLAAAEEGVAIPLGRWRCDVSVQDTRPVVTPRPDAVEVVDGRITTAERDTHRPIVIRPFRATLDGDNITWIAWSDPIGP